MISNTSGNKAQAVLKNTISLPDQKKVWNKKHSADDHESLRFSPSHLANLAEPYFPRKAKILELGCGVGRDAFYLEKSGHMITSTDSSEIAINKNKNSFSKSKVKFKVLDIGEKLPYKSGMFDVVYANLSLHYFLDSKTREIFKNIAKILKTDGIFAFSCKSHDEYRTNGAQRVEKNVYFDKNKHAIHLFSTEYVNELMNDFFDIIHLDDVDENYAGRISGIVRCIARKKI